MKVLFISGGDYKYGAPKSMITMIEGLRELYHIEAVLLTKKRNALNEYCDRHGIENYSLWYRDIMVGSPYTSKILTAAKHTVKYSAYLLGDAARKKIDKLPLDFSTIDIVHSNTNRQDIGAYIASRYHLKHVWHIREMGKEDYNVIFYKRNCIRYMNRHADAFIMISNVVNKKWIRMGIDSHKAHIVYDGMETDRNIDRINAASHDHNSKKRLRLVITGHVQPNKGQLHLVRAIAALPENLRQNIELDIIGEAYPDYRKIIETEINRAGLNEQIHLLGYLDNIQELLPSYDIGVTCSKAEALGRCTIEYMLAGLLTIASNTGANPEIIQDKRTGLLYEYGNDSSLCRAVSWGIQHTMERTMVADAGKKAAQKMFSKEEHAEKIYEVYMTCMNS